MLNDNESILREGGCLLSEGGRQRRDDSVHSLVVTTKVALALSSELAYEDWERAGRQLAGVLSSSSWWLGDWLIYGEGNYKGRYKQAVRATGFKYQTLRNYAWVAKKISAASAPAAAELPAPCIACVVQR